MTDKPLGRKSYGSIPHLPGSRMGPAEHTVMEGQARIATEKKRDKNDNIIVQEKLDGSCVAVANVDGEILALGRAGYLAQTSPFEQHQLFADWVRKNLDLFTFLLPGQRVVGEWLAQAHGTRYDLWDVIPFVPFDLMVGTDRATVAELSDRLDERLHIPRILNDGMPMSIEKAMGVLAGSGFHGALDPVEGAVWRVERNGTVDFLVKYVRPDKVDGLYLPEVSGKDAVWNWRP